MNILRVCYLPRKNKRDEIQRTADIVSPVIPDFSISYLSISKTGANLKNSADF